MCWTTTSYPERRNTQSRLSVYNLVYLRSVSTCSAIVEWGLCLGERQVLQYDNTGVREDGILGDIEVRGYGTVRGLQDTGIRKIYDEGKYTTKQNRPGFENIEVRVATRTWEYNDTSLKISMYFRTVHLSCSCLFALSCPYIFPSSHPLIPFSCRVSCL